VCEREVNNSIRARQIHNNNRDIKGKATNRQNGKRSESERDGLHKVHSNDLIITEAKLPGALQGAGGFHSTKGGIWSARRLEHNSCFWLFRRVACDLRFVPPKRERDRKRVWEQMQTIIEIYYDYCTPVECSLQYAMCNVQCTMYNVQTAIWQRCTDSPKSLKCGNSGKGIWNGTKMKLMRTERLVEILFSESTF